MAHDANHTRRLAETEEALLVLFCLVDDAYTSLNPGARRYKSPKLTEHPRSASVPC